MNQRGIQTGTSWIIGYPGESKESMEETIRVAAEIKHHFPNSASDIFPFRPIPGTEDFDTAVKLGYQAPKTLADWGDCLEYKLEVDDIRLPQDVFETWRRYNITASFYDNLVHEGSGFVRDFMHKISGWRLRKHNYAFPLEQKLFHLFVKLTRQTQEQKIKADQTSGVTPHAPVG